MNFISDILFWISEGLLVPVIVLLILLFLRSLLLIGSFFGQYMNIRKSGRALRLKIEGLTADRVDELQAELPQKNVSLAARYLREILAHKDGYADTDGACARGVVNRRHIVDGIQYAGGIRNDCRRPVLECRRLHDPAGQKPMVYAGHDKPRVRRRTVERQEGGVRDETQTTDRQGGRE